MSKAIISGENFKSLISNVTKMPSVGAFANSELVNIEIKNGVCYANTFGVILSTAQVEAKGIFPLVGIDERLLQPYSNLCSDKAQVLFELTGTDIQIKTKRDQVTAAFTKGTHHEIKPSGGHFKASTDLAKKIRYLSEIAFSDSSRPELNCVYLDGQGRAVAVNQKLIAVFATEDKPQKTALPIPLARILGDDYKVYAGENNETILQNEMAAYSMPSPVLAYKNFPIAFVDKCQAAEAEQLCTVSGEKLMQMITECSSCLGSISRLEVILHFSITDGKIELKSENGGAKFRTATACVTSKEAEIRIPLEEISRASAFLAVEPVVTIKQGAGGETFLAFPGGWLMFPSFSTGKKKK